MPGCHWYPWGCCCCHGCCCHGCCCCCHGCCCCCCHGCCCCCHGCCCCCCSHSGCCCGCCGCCCAGAMPAWTIGKPSGMALACGGCCCCGCCCCCCCCCCCGARLLLQLLLRACCCCCWPPSGGFCASQSSRKSMYCAFLLSPCIPRANAKARKGATRKPCQPSGNGPAASSAMWQDGTHANCCKCCQVPTVLAVLRQPVVDSATSSDTPSGVCVCDHSISVDVHRPKSVIFCWGAIHQVDMEDLPLERTHRTRLPIKTGRSAQVARDQSEKATSGKAAIRYALARESVALQTASSRVAKTKTDTHSTGVSLGASETLCNCLCCSCVANTALGVEQDRFRATLDVIATQRLWIRNEAAERAAAAAVVAAAAEQ